MKQPYLALFILASLVGGCTSTLPPTQKPTATASNWRAQSSYTAQFLVAETAFNREDYETAFAAYRKAAELTDDTSALSYISDRAIAYEQFDIASEVINRWLSVQPDSSKAYLAATIVAIHRQDLDDADEYIQRVFDLRQGDAKLEDINRIARASAESLDPDTALTFFYDSIVIPNEDEPEAWLQYAQIAEYHERFDLVEEAITNNAWLSNTNNRVALLLYRARLINGDAKGAEKALTDFLKANKGDNANPVENELVRFYFDDERNYDKALDLSTALIKKGAYFPRINFTAVVLAQRLDRPKTTRKLLTQLLSSDFPDPEFQLSVAELAIEVEQYDLAEQEMAKITDPAYESAIDILRSNIMLKTEGSDAQITYLRSALKESTSFSEPLVNATFYAMTEADEDQEAFQFIDRLIEQFPEETDLYYTRGLYLANEGEVDRAISDFEAVLAREPNNSAALNALGYTLADNNIELTRALNLIEKAAELDPESSYILDSLGWVHFRLGNYEIAENYLISAYEQNQEAEIKAHLAELYFAIGKTEEAKKLLDEAIVEYPENGVVADTHRRLAD